VHETSCAPSIQAVAFLPAAVTMCAIVQRVAE